MLYDFPLGIQNYLAFHNVYKLSCLIGILIITTRLYRIYLSFSDLYIILFSLYIVITSAAVTCVCDKRFIYFFFSVASNGVDIFPECNTNTTPQKKITIQAVELRDRINNYSARSFLRLNFNVHAVIALNHKFFFHVSYSIYIHK